MVIEMGERAIFVAALSENTVPQIFDDDHFPNQKSDDHHFPYRFMLFFWYLYPLFSDKATYAQGWVKVETQRTTGVWPFLVLTCIKHPLKLECFFLTPSHMGVSINVSKWMVFVRDNPNLKWMMTGGCPS